MFCLPSPTKITYHVSLDPNCNRTYPKTVPPNFGNLLNSSKKSQDLFLSFNFCVQQQKTQAAYASINISLLVAPIS